MCDDRSMAAGAVRSRPRLVVLVHGAWHGAWCWAGFQAELDRRGVPSLAVDLPGHGASTEPLGDLHGDAAAVGRVLDAAARRRPDVTDDGVVLVGHSYGGAVITQAALDRDDIAQLVYVAAFALDGGESVMGALSTFDRRDVALAGAMVPNEDGTITTIDPNGAVASFYADSPPDIAAAAIPRLGPQPMATMTQPTTASPLGSIPSTYVRCARDAAVHPDHQAVMADRCDVAVTIDTDHSPFISAVAELAGVVETAARGAS